MMKLAEESRKTMKEKINKILDRGELKLIKKLNTPIKIQDYLDNIPFNFEENGETYMSPRMMIVQNKAHCFEGALFASLCLSYHGFENFLVDLKVKKSAKKDCDHVVCAFRVGNAWGAVSKTNHSVLRYRDPIHKDAGEVARSYFHEYFLDNGEKTLESYSKAFDVWKKFGLSTAVSEDDLDRVALLLDKSPHTPFITRKSIKYVKKASKVEIKGAGIIEWKATYKNDKMG